MTADKADKSRHTPWVILTGNPNCGKTTIFNALTGLRAKVGNYAGVTVERKEGRLMGAPAGETVMVLDLPGAYSLSPQSLDEQVARDVLFNRLDEVPPPQAVVVVADASNLERNLYFATQVIELGYPTILALNMMDVAGTNGQKIDLYSLALRLKATVVPMIASKNKGIPELREAILNCVKVPNGAARPDLFCDLPPAFRAEVDQLAERLEEAGRRCATPARSEALILLGNAVVEKSSNGLYSEEVLREAGEARARLEKQGVDWNTAGIVGRHAQASAIYADTVTSTMDYQPTYSDKLDRVLTHKVWGMVIFALVMALMFQSIFSLARLPMEILDAGVSWIGTQAGRLIPPGDLHSLLIDGAIAGAGAVLVFLPQICLLFLCIGVLEDTGYMARAAFIMDRLMSKVGLHGKSFIPMLSSYACAIPGIMAARTIESPKDRLVTILVSPLMSCSARLPVYTLLIATSIPNIHVLGFFKLPGLVMLSMYFLGTSMALAMAWLFKRTLLKSAAPLLILELPPYKRPSLRLVLRHVWERAKLFLKKAGTVILGINILLWFLATYPRNSEMEHSFTARREAVKTQAAAPGANAQAIQDQMDSINVAQSSARLQHSFAGRLGHWIEPAIAPLGFDWKIGIGIVASFAAREVFVSTMSTVYSVSTQGKSDEAAQSLALTMREQKRPDGTPMFSALTAVTLMVFYVFALQCVSTVAVVRRETNSWKWPLFQWAYMGVLAWGFAFVIWHAGRALGWG
jgi:ferrous iron transport protein B